MKALILVGIAFTLLLLIAIAVAQPAAENHAQSQTADALVQINDIPEPVQTAITNGSLGKKYEVSFHLSPFYLRGDFNGDGKSDVAVLVKQRSTEKLGIRHHSWTGHQRNNSRRRKPPSVTVVMISNGWTTGRFTRKTLLLMQPEHKASQACAETPFL